jgi:hypothetical protein
MGCILAVALSHTLLLLGEWITPVNPELDLSTLQTVEVEIRPFTLFHHLRGEGFISQSVSFIFNERNVRFEKQR